MNMNSVLQPKTLFAFCRQRTVRLYSQTIVAGMPRHRISLKEKIVHGLIIGGSMLATPVWVLSHLKYYRGGPELAEWHDDYADQDCTMPKQARENRYGMLEEMKRGNIPMGGDDIHVSGGIPFRPN